MPPRYDRCSDSSSDLAFMAIARTGANESSDWWRQVGAILVKNGEILFQSHNRHFPSDHTPYINGDPRDVIEAGKDSHIATAVHAEQGIIAEAAANGISTKGADIYVSVFPCPMCARLIALSGIKRCFFSFGHASLDGEEIMKSAGVELIWVKI
jgi:dCMP deaminase